MTRIKDGPAPVWATYAATAASVVSCVPNERQQSEGKTLRRYCLCPLPLVLRKTNHIHKTERREGQPLLQRRRALNDVNRKTGDRPGSSGGRTPSCPTPYIRNYFSESCSGTAVSPHNALLFLRAILATHALQPQVAFAVCPITCSPGRPVAHSCRLTMTRFRWCSTTWTAVWNAHLTTRRTRHAASSRRLPSIPRGTRWCWGTTTTSTYSRTTRGGTKLFFSGLVC